MFHIQVILNKTIKHLLRSIVFGLDIFKLEQVTKTKKRVLLRFWFQAFANDRKSNEAVGLQGWEPVIM